MGDESAVRQLTFESFAVDFVHDEVIGFRLPERRFLRRFEKRNFPTSPLKIGSVQTVGETSSSGNNDASFSGGGGGGRESVGGDGRGVGGGVDALPEARTRRDNDTFFSDGGGGGGGSGGGVDGFHEARTIRDNGASLSDGEREGRGGSGVGDGGGVPLIEMRGRI